MMSFFYKYKCSVCKDKISDKTHDWCMSNGTEDLCYDHIPTEVRLKAMTKRYEKPFALNK